MSDNDASARLFVNAPAKINLNLRIAGKRDDGYHLLDSAVGFSQFGDRLRFLPSSKDEIVVEGPFADHLAPGTADGSNLCLRAIAAYRAAGGMAARHKIILDKQIPVGAGLGGGSADAAAVLRYLNDTAQAPLRDAMLQKVAATLGADVPVCLAMQSQRMRGIGEIITPLAMAGTTHLLLANPNVSLITADVFWAWSQSGAHHPAMASDVIYSRGVALSAAALMTIGNDLTAAAISLVPAIDVLLQDLLQLDDVCGAAMSGSGASCFALFDQEDACLAAQEALRRKGYWAVATALI